MSQTRTMVVWAHLKGYRVIGGRVVGPSGKCRKTRVYQRGKGVGYAMERFTVRSPEGRTIPIPVHQLLAFQKFGEAVLKSGVQVRHANGDSLDNSDANVLIGSATDNAMDRSPLSRKEHAAKGRQTYTAKVIEAIRADHAGGMGYKKLRRKHGVPLATLSYYLSKTAQRTSFNFPKPQQSTQGHR